MATNATGSEIRGFTSAVSSGIAVPMDMDSQSVSFLPFTAYLA